MDRTNVSSPVLRPNPGADRRTPRIGTALLVVLALGAGRATAQQSGEPEKPASGAVVEMRDTLDRYFQARRLISEERRDWKTGREMVEQRIELGRHEIDSLRTRIADAESNIGAAEKSRAELDAERAALDEVTEGLAKTVVTLELRTKALLKRLPEPLLDKVRLYAQRIPEDSETSKADLAERYAFVIGVLNELNRLNREITLTSEVRKLPSGVEEVVTSVYVGLGQGYYVTAKRDVAAIGTATADGWEWTPANDAAGAIAKVVAILEGREAAAFVPLPVRIQ